MRKVVAIVVLLLVVVGGWLWWGRDDDGGGVGGVAPRVQGASQVGGKAASASASVSESVEPVPVESSEPVMDEAEAAYHAAEDQDAEGTMGCVRGEAGCAPTVAVKEASVEAGGVAEQYFEAYWTWPEGNLDAWVEASAAYATQGRHREDVAHAGSGWVSDREFYSRYHGSCRGRVFDTGVDVFAGEANTADRMNIWLAGRVECESDADTEAQKARNKAAWADKHTGVSLWSVGVVKDGSGVWRVESMEATGYPVDFVEEGQWESMARK